MRSISLLPVRYIDVLDMLDILEIYISPLQKCIL